MAPFSSLLFLVVIKRPFLWLLATRATGLFTFRSEISITMFVGGIETVWFYLGSWPYPNVHYSFSIHAFSVFTFFLLADNESRNDNKYRRFCRQLLHSSLRNILEPVRPHMTSPKIVRCPDGHYHRAIFSLGPYIADYPEQCLLLSIVQGWCPRYIYDCCCITLICSLYDLF